MNSPIAVFADLHADGSPEFGGAWAAAVADASARGAREIWIAGDAVDKANFFTPKAGSGAVLRGLTAPLIPFLADGGAVLTIRGNHDRLSDAPAARLDALVALEDIGCEVLRYCKIHYDFGAIGAPPIACIPWHDTLDCETEYAALLAEAVPGMPLIGHLSVAGSRRNGGDVAPASGRWTLSRESLERWPGPVFLGHHHARQPDLAGEGRGGYIGQIWQKDFNTAGNQTGYELFWPETGAREWVPVNVAPKHYVEVRGSEDDAAVGMAYWSAAPNVRAWIKTDGFKASPELESRAKAAGVRITPINLPRPERIGRTVALPEGGALPAPRAALELYNKAQARPLEDSRLARALARFDRLMADCPALGAPVVAGVGAPTTHWVKASGIGSLPDGFEFDFDSLPAFSAFTGDNGAGKTTLAGLGFLALYGRIPGYDGAAYDRLTRGGTGRADVEAGLSYGGKRYRVERSMRGGNSKSKSQSASIYSIDKEASFLETGPGEVLIAGPGTREFQAAVDALFGPAHVAEVVSFRGGTGNDFASIPRAERRAVLARMLGLGAFEKIADKARDIALGIDKAERDRAARLTANPIGLVEELKAREWLEESRAAYATAKDASAAAQEALTRAAEALTLANQASPDTAAIVERHALAEKTLGLARKEESYSRAAVEKIEAATARIPDLEANVTALTTARARIESLEADADKFKARAAWETKRWELTAGLESSRKELAALELIPGADAETIALAEDLEPAREQYRAAQEENKYRTQRNATLANRKAEIEAKFRDASREVERIEKRIEAAPVPPLDAAPDVCVRCPLRADFAGLPAALEAAKRKREDAFQDVSVIPSPEAMIDMTPIMERGNAAAAADKAVKAAGEAQKKTQPVRDHIGSVTELIRAHDAAEPPAVEDPAEGLKAARAEERRLADAPEKLAQARKDSEGATAASARLSAALKALKAATETEAEHRAAADRARLSRAEAEAEIERAKDAKRQAETAARNDADALTAAGRTLAQAESKLETVLAAIAERDREREASELAAAELEDLRWIAKAFGPEGVAPLLIDAVAPRIEELANAALNEATHGRLSLMLATQDVGADGKTREDLRIVVRDDRGEDDLANYSTGQREIVGLLLTAAIAEWIAEHHGGAVEQLILDEFGRNLTPDNQELLAGIIGALAKRMRIVLITPNPAVAALADGVVNVTLDAMGRTLANIGGE